jgi:uncharacterized coiled-coil DUF342 family protein
MQQDKIQQQITNLRTLEDAYRFKAKEIIEKLKQVVRKRKELEKLISPGNN